MKCKGLWARWASGNSNSHFPLLCFTVPETNKHFLPGSPIVWNRHISTTSRPWNSKTDNIPTSLLATRWPSDSTDVSSETTGTVANHILVTPQSCISAPLPVNKTFWWWLVLFGPFGICKCGKSLWKKKILCRKQLEVKRDGSIQAAGTQRHFFHFFFFLKANASAAVTQSCPVFGHEKGGNPGSKVRILFYFSP